MSILPVNIVDLVNAEKKLLKRPIWDSKSDRRYNTFLAPLVIIGDPIAGFEIRVKVSKTVIDRDCSIHLEFSSGGRDRVVLARCQWRPFETHTNPAWGPPGYELRRFISESHIHAFEANYVPHNRRMRSGNVCAAYPIEPDPATLSEFVAFSGSRFKIINMDVIDLPLMQPDFFWVRHDPSQ